MPFLRNSQKAEKVDKKTKNAGKTIVRMTKTRVFVQNTDVFLLR